MIGLNLIFYFAWMLFLPEKISLHNFLFLQKSIFLNIVNCIFADHLSFANDFHTQIRDGAQHNNNYLLFPLSWIGVSVCWFNQGPKFKSSTDILHFSGNSLVHGDIFNLYGHFTVFSWIIGHFKGDMRMRLTLFIHHVWSDDPRIALVSHNGFYLKPALSNKLFSFTKFEGDSASSFLNFQ